MSKLIIKKNDDNIDYLVLVNKNSKIPDDWEKIITFIHTKNVWNEDIQVEENTYQHYLKLKEELEKENILSKNCGMSGQMILLRGIVV